MSRSNGSGSTERVDSENRIEMAAVHADDAVLDRASEVLRSGRYVKGPVLREFEAAFASFCEVEHAVGLSSGTAALTLGMKACGIGPGDEVFVPGHTFFATASPVLALGATPVFVDCDPGSYTIDTGDLALKIANSDAPAAVVPVHLYGHPAAMDRVLDIAAENGMAVIEDACQAHGARYQGDRVGGIGDVGCFSFYPSKNMTVGGDGGMLVTDNAKQATRARELRDHGRNGAGDHVRLGLNYRLDELNAAIGLEQLAQLPDWNRRRRAIAASYTDRLAAIETVRTPTIEESVEHVFHQYVIRVPDRAALRASLDERGIDTDVHYPTPAHRHAAIENQIGKAEALDVTERLSDRIVSLPMHPELDGAEIDRVCTAIEDYYGNRDHGRRETGRQRSDRSSTGRAEQ